MHHTPEILIVDDEPRMCDSLKVLLENEGYRAHTADSGEKAMACLSGKTIDLILLDIVMPDMNGLQIMDFIRREKLETLVIGPDGEVRVDRAIAQVVGC